MILCIEHNDVHGLGMHIRCLIQFEEDRRAARDRLSLVEGHTDSQAGKLVCLEVSRAIMSSYIHLSQITKGIFKGTLILAMVPVVCEVESKVLIIVKVSSERLSTCSGNVD